MPDVTVSADVDSMLRSANDAAIRSAIGVGTTDAPTFLSLKTTATGSVSSPSIAINANTGFYNSTVNELDMTVAGVSSFAFFADGMRTLASGLIGWSDSAADLAGGATNLRLYRDAPGILAQRNGSSPQAFRVANQVGALPLTDYDRAVFDFKTTLNTLRIGTENSGTTGYTTARPIDFVTGGVVRMSIGAAGGVTCAGSLTMNGPIFGGIGQYIAINQTSVLMWSPSSGVMLLQNAAGNDFNRIQLGSTADTHPAIARDGAGIKITGAATGLTSWIKVPAVAVSALPLAATAGVGARSFVNDALTPVFGSAVTGGGAVAVPVYSTGSAWNVG